MHIQGPAGQLEARLDQAPAEKTITAVLCHPHPQYGGSMHDAVLATAVEVLMGAGVNCLRFNFRGVGGSEGQFDNGDGEVLDAVAAVDWVRQEYPRDEIWLIGYSFGASVAWRAASSIDPARLILIAPPVGMMKFEANATTAQVDAIAGSRDDFVDQATFNAWEDVDTHVIDGADHFFGGYHDALAETLSDLVQPKMI